MGSTGGGIYVGKMMVTNLWNTTVSGNVASYDGGGVEGGNTKTIAMINCSVTDNTSKYASGGGIGCIDCNEMHITDCDISGNT